MTQLCVAYVRAHRLRHTLINHKREPTTEPLEPLRAATTPQRAHRVLNSYERAGRRRGGGGG